MRSRRTVLAATSLAGAMLVSLAAPGAAGAAPTPRATPAIDDAVEWLETQQQSDGGFEVSGFPGFETSDAVLAIAMAGQTTATWSEAEALAAVEGVTTGGKDALDALDDWVDSVRADPEATTATKAQQAAKLVALVTVPLGLDEGDFDPSNDTTPAVDLLATIQAGAGTGDYAALPFNGRAYVLWALGALGVTVPPALGTAIGAAQQANGGWSYSGDATGTGFDPDTTAATLIALRVAQRPTTDPAVVKGVRALGLQQRWNGEWAGEFDDGNPNSTALAALALATLGGDPASSCRRNTIVANMRGVAYPSPLLAIERRQQADGRVTSPSDGFGVNTFATTQGIQALAAAQDAWPYGDIAACTQPDLEPNRRVVHAQFADLLLRVADDGGAAYWTQQMNSGLSGGFLAKRFTGTPEYGQQVVDGLVRAALGRAATAQERSASAPQIVAGRRLEVAAALLGGQEYYDLTAPVFPSGPPTDQTWIAAVYPDTVGRAASASDEDYVEAQLAAGRTRTQIARQLLGSIEGRGVTVRDIYRQLLGRNPSTADRAYWGELLRTGSSPERLVTLIAGSNEYRAKALV